ncbi:MAG: NTP transferase domain-containing protein [Gammaproteobacteria bacterium]|nr:NTP transferase domain-containing protein [Gammaproteobacteria bacterium]NIM71770.1 NTP transferase domain-containing protein [Gammaproteobacteria bacterium]NIN37866.1 NTP transferase domain-containing protein [Gammaproteobacteria bacterium]NIO23526.1 NTP transferase domain-containing protein [Gammaproteobacteria bacterium]NIO64142.1 NTP transferase domain-containing protein [Gammaproteobacteria bacterium]
MAAAPEKVPVIVLGGRDVRRGEMPEGVDDLHPLAGYKGVVVRIGGRALIERVVDRLGESGQFGSVYIAGPRAVYADHRAGAQIIDVTGSIDETVRAGIEAVSRAHPGAPVAMTTCDVLPDAATLARVMAEYGAMAPCDGFLPMIRAPEDHEALGVSAYKPFYRVVPEAGAAPVEVLPCHLAVLDPQALRMQFIYRTLRLIYRTRNRPIGYRRGVILRGIFWELLYQDLLHLLGLRLPTLTWSVLSAGLPAVRALRAGTITRAHLEHAMRRIFVTARHQSRHPQRRILMPIVEGLSLALDIDTEEEAAALGADIE